MPTKLHLWVWDGQAQKSWRILDDEDYNVWWPGQGTVVNTSYEQPYTTVVTVAFPYDTRGHQNGLHSIGISGQFGNPFGDPIVLGSPPPDAHTNGQSGGAEGSMDLLNLVVSSYSTSNGTQDYLKYDPDGGQALARPEVTFTVEDAAPSPLTCQVWIEPTESREQPQTPEQFAGPFTSHDVSGPGTYTHTWDGSCYPGGEADQATCGTYTFDVYAFKGWDWASAKTPYNLWVPAQIQHNGQAVAGHNAWFREDLDPVPLRANYAVQSSENVSPQSVTLVGLDGTLTERGSLAGDTGLNELHNGANDDGLDVCARGAEEVPVPPWRVIVTAVSGSGSDVRRDRQCPRMLAVNALAGQNGCFQVWMDNSGESCNVINHVAGQLDYIDYDCQSFAWRWSRTGTDNRYERINAALPVHPGYGLGGSWGWIPRQSNGKPSASCAAYHVTTMIVGSGAAGADLGNLSAQSGTPALPDLGRISEDAIEAAGYQNDQIAKANAVLHELGHAAGLSHDARNTVMRTPSQANGDGTNGIPLWTTQFQIAWGPAPSDPYYYDRWPAETRARVKAMQQHCKIR